MGLRSHWPQYAVPDGVGGRFSIFCEVGLSLAACVGFDIKSFLQGAQDMDKACQNDDIWQNPAMLNAALKFAASEKHGRDIEVMMPYGDYMQSISEWYIQLLAESLGKQYNKEGKEVCYGRTPLVAVGTRDMHSQTQQHQQAAAAFAIQYVRLWLATASSSTQHLRTGPCNSLIGRRYGGGVGNRPRCARLPAKPDALLRRSWCMVLLRSYCYFVSAITTM